MNAPIDSLIAGLLLALSQPSLSMAATADEVEAQFDRSGDKLVDAEDWKQLSKQERRDYVRALLQAYSPHHTPADDRRTTLYLNAITSLYHYR